MWWMYALLAAFFAALTTILGKIGVQQINSNLATGRASSVLFLTIDKCKFRRQVVPGDRVEFHMTKLNHKRNFWWYRGEAKVDGVLCCEAEISAMMIIGAR